MPLSDSKFATPAEDNKVILGSPSLPMSAKMPTTQISHHFKRRRVATDLGLEPHDMSNPKHISVMDTPPFLRIQADAHQTRRVTKARIGHIRGKAEDAKPPSLSCWLLPASLGARRAGGQKKERPPFTSISKPMSATRRGRVDAKSHPAGHASGHAKCETPTRAPGRR